MRPQRDVPPGASARTDDEPMVTAVLEALHTAALASWFGCMCYSVMFIQRHPMRGREPQVWEDFVTEMVHGVRVCGR